MTLTAIRHGQASYGTDDYDRLSPAGWEQSRRLGEWLAGHGQTFRHVVCGAMRRHRETFEAIAGRYEAYGIALPEPVFDPDLNEFDHRAVIDAYLAERPDARSAAVGSGERPTPQSVMRLLHGALSRWAEGAYEQQLAEGWTPFGERVARGGGRLLELTTDGDVLLVSSGGTLSRLAQRALEAPDLRTVELNLSLRNSGMCEFHSFSGALRLGSWNSLPHLADARELWTYF
jgi:broad specificity phosphatase PhoE